MSHVVQALLILAGIYAVACTVWPWTNHGRCSGTGKLPSPSGKAWRDCPGCTGTGKVERWGRRLFR